MKELKRIAQGPWGSVLEMPEQRRMPPIVADFTRQLVTNIARTNGTFLQTYGNGDYPLRYDERRMGSVIAASIDQVTDHHMSEFACGRSVKLPKRKGQASGRMAFWAYYRRTDFGIEVKRVIWGASNNSMSACARRWKELVDQVVSAKKSMNWSSRSIGLGLLVVFAYSTSSTKRKLRQTTSIETLDRFMSLANSSGMRPAFCAAWRPPGGEAVFQDWNNRWERVPAVMFLGHASYGRVR